MNLQPFQQTLHCPVCGYPAKNHAHIKACSLQCIRGGVKNWIDGTERRSIVQVHLHVQCPRCDFMWLEEPVNPSEVETVW